MGPYGGYGDYNRSPAPVLVLLFLLGIGVIVLFNMTGMMPEADLTPNSGEPSGGGMGSQSTTSLPTAVPATATLNLEATQVAMQNEFNSNMAQVTQAAGAFQKEKDAVKLQATKQALNQQAVNTSATQAAIEWNLRVQAEQNRQQAVADQQNSLVLQSVLVLSVGGVAALFLLAVGLAIRHNQEARRKLIEADAARLVHERELSQARSRELQNRIRELEVQKELAATKVMYPNNGYDHGKQHKVEQDGPEGYNDLPFAE